MMVKDKCKNCKDIVAKFYNCDICSYADNMKGDNCTSKLNNKVISCVINVSSKSIPSVEGLVLPSANSSTLF